MNYAATTDEMVRRIGTIPDEVGAGTCFGTAIEREGHTLIPVARVSFGYGLGFGGGTGAKGNPDDFGVGASDVGEGGGGGGGGGGSSSPVAVIDITRDDVVIKPVHDTTRIAMAGLMFAAWAIFWGTLTVRTVARETSKTRRQALEKS